MLMNIIGDKVGLYGGQEGSEVKMVQICEKEVQDYTSDEVVVGCFRTGGGDQMEQGTASTD